MNLIKSSIISIMLLLTTFGAQSVQASNEPYPLEYFALREVINNVSISPDGNKLALHKIPNKDGDPIIEIYDANDLTKEPFRVNADPMEIRGSNWVSDTQMVLLLRQKVRDKIDGFNRGVYSQVLAKLDVNKRKIKKFEFDGQSPSIASLLVDKPNKILIGFDGDDSYFSPTDYYELDLKSGRKKLILRGSPAVPNVTFDAYGNPVYGYSFDGATGMYSWHIRKPGSKKWIEIYRLSEDSYEKFDVQGQDPKNPNMLFVVAQNGRDKAGLWEFDINKKAFGELIYARKDVDVSGTRQHSNYWTNPDEIVAVRYRTDKSHYEYFDAVEEATYKQIEGLLPAVHSVSIQSRSRDGKTLVLGNSGPRDPGTYYLLKDGKLQTIGSIQPLLKSKDLADVKYISYESRDGKEIRAYLTVPNTKGPHPLVVMPHGGPFVSEVVGYDEWGQMLANNGYMVLQPQYRGSENYGLEFYKSAFIEKGEAGYSMQDDKDDGALHLIQQGLVDKDRVAMFGWSYGGYAALIAASRKDQIYQCAIAGASVADMIMQVNYYLSRLRGAQLEQQVKYRKGSINPIDVVEDVNIPLFVIHGSVDQRVPLAHAKKYIKLLEENNIPYKYLELDGADHFYDTLSFSHQKDLFDGMIDFLKNDCGPGGL